MALSRAGEPTGRRRNGIKYSGRVGRRGGDDAKHFGGHRLLLQGLGQIGGALFQFLE